MASPSLAALAALPNRFRLTLLTMFPSVTEYLRDQEFTEDVRFVDFLNGPLRFSLATLWRLRRERFDCSVIPYAHNRIEYNVFSRAVGARWRIGFRYQRQKRMNLPGLNQCVLDEEPHLHNVQEHLRWAAQLIGTDWRTLPDDTLFRTSPEAADEAGAFLNTRGLEQASPLIGIHASCNPLKNQQRRCWPAPRFTEFIERLAGQVPSARFLVFEGPQDARITRQVHTESGLVALAKLLPMRVVGALIRRCQLFLSNDSGLMHVAAACKVPCVAIFGPTNPTWVRPWKTECIVVSRHLPCSPCFYYSSRPLGCPANLDYACVRELPVEQVEHAALRLLKVGQA